MVIGTFQNLPVALTEQPQLSGLIWQALAPGYLRLNLWINIITTVLLTGSWLLIWLQPFWPVNQTLGSILLWGGAALSLLGLLSVGYCYLAYPRKAYALRQHDLSFRSGLVFQKSVTQPILRIQHIELKRGPLERRFGLASLQVFSAGGAMHTFKIPGLLLTDAQAIRQLILQHRDTLQHD